MLCKVFLRHCIVYLELSSLDDFNNRLKNFDFQQFGHDKPAAILIEHLADGNMLRQNAGQLITLAHTMLFIIGEWIVPNVDENLTEHVQCTC